MPLVILLKKTSNASPSQNAHHLAFDTLRLAVLVDRALLAPALDLIAHLSVTMSNSIGVIDVNRSRLEEVCNFLHAVRSGFEGFVGSGNERTSRVRPFVSGTNR